MRDAWSFTGRISIPFPPPPSPFLFFFFFFRYIIGATGLRFLCDASVCPTFDTRDVQIDSIETIFLPFFPPCYTRNTVSKSLRFNQAERDIVKKKIYIYHTGGYFFSCNIYFTEINYIRRGTCDLIVLKFLSIFISLIYRNKSLAYIQSLLFEYTTISPK